MKNCLPADMLELSQQCPLRVVALDEDEIDRTDSGDRDSQAATSPSLKRGCMESSSTVTANVRFPVTSVSSIASAWTTPGGSCFVNI